MFEMQTYLVIAAGERGDFNKGISTRREASLWDIKFYLLKAFEFCLSFFVIESMFAETIFIKPTTDPGMISFPNGMTFKLV